MPTYKDYQLAHSVLWLFLDKSCKFCCINPFNTADRCTSLVVPFNTPRLLFQSENVNKPRMTCQCTRKCCLCIFQRIALWEHSIYVYFHFRKFFVVFGAKMIKLQAIRDNGIFFEKMARMSLRSRSFLGTKILMIWGILTL